MMEGNSGQREVEVVIVLSQPATVPVKVTYHTKSGSASAGTDYIADSNSICFSSGKRIKKISIRVSGDAVCEQNEEFEIALTNPTGAFLSISTTVMLAKLW